MEICLRGVVFAVAVLLAACAGPSGSSDRAKPAAFEPPPSNYVHLARTAVVQGDTLVIGADDHAELEENDGVVALGFQLSYGMGLRDVQPVARQSTGSGLAVDDPIRIASAEDELKDALDLMAHRNPDWTPTIGHLYRGPDDDYIMLVEFKSAAGVKPLYFDVTEWAQGFMPS